MTMLFQANFLRLLFLSSLVLTGCSLRPMENLPNADQPRTITDLGGKTVTLPSTVPEKTKYLLLGVFTVSIRNQPKGVLIVYTNSKTTPEPNYEEFYDMRGNLISIRWIDEQNIPRTATDAGTLKNDESTPEGLLLLVPDGKPL